MRPALIAILTLLLLPAAASAGGWASAGVLNPPRGVAPGETWKAQIEILQHGRRPMTGVTPAVVVGDERFPASGVEGRPGVYEAEVVFRRAGRVEYTVDDGFTNAEPHTFVAVIETASAPAPARGSGFPWLPVGGGALAALAVVLLLTRRRRNAVPA